MFQVPGSLQRYGQGQVLLRSALPGLPQFQRDSNSQRRGVGGPIPDEPITIKLRSSVLFQALGPLGYPGLGLRFVHMYFDQHTRRRASVFRNDSARPYHSRFGDPSLACPELNSPNRPDRGSAALCLRRWTINRGLLSTSPKICLVDPPYTLALRCLFKLTSPVNSLRLMLNSVPFSKLPSGISRFKPLLNLKQPATVAPLALLQCVPAPAARVGAHELVPLIRPPLPKPAPTPGADWT